MRLRFGTDTPRVKGLVSVQGRKELSSIRVVTAVLSQLKHKVSSSVLKMS